MCEELQLKRFDQTPWGFRLTGGLDFGTPLTVVKVTGGSVAELGGVQVGDLVVEINGQGTKHMTHTDAQNCIARAINRLSLSVMRGSLVTPPEVTPLRGMTPLVQNQNNSQNQLNPDLLKKHLNEVIMNGSLPNLNSEDGLKEPAQVKEMTRPTGHHSSIETNNISSLREKQVEIITHSTNLTETELAEVLTGNEEVLDQGVLGINFQKFIPQVDFIRESEVFKFLQQENVKKDVPEQEQLKKEPMKRFSTFLMKPKAPPEKVTGPQWHYPKAPRYLPRESSKPKEVPKRRIFRPPPPKEEEGHSVLWLFLAETGNDVVDERWGSQEEERINLSRNTFREDDEMSIASSTKVKVSGTAEIEESMSESEREKKIIAEIVAFETEEKLKDNFREDECEISSISSADHLRSSIENLRSSVTSEIVEKSQVQETVKEKKTLEYFTKQLAEIQEHIAALDNDVPSELQTHLTAVQEQLAKIARLQMIQAKHAKKQKAKMEHSEESFSESETKVDYKEEHFREEHYKEEKHFKQETHFQEESSFKEENRTYKREKYDKQNYKYSEEDSEKYSTYDTEDEWKEEWNKETDTETHDEEIISESGNVQSFQRGDYEICQTEAPKKKALPLTPQMRPIVLPGGRMWRQPKDAAHEEFYTGVLVAQAEVLVGSTDTSGLNFTKYVPPKFDMSHSEVYRLIHEIEDRTKEHEKDRIYEKAAYNTPISKRHFYAATLPQPKPMGDVELKDL